MPLYEYQCPQCEETREVVYLGRDIVAHEEKVAQWCWNCDEEMSRVMSAPASIKMADMEKINRRRQRIKEPMWRDLKTGKLTPVNP